MFTSLIVLLYNVIIIMNDDDNVKLSVSGSSSGFRQ
jgi:hypothetical protein